MEQKKSVPVASSKSVSAKMAAQRGRDTACEMELRRELHRMGLRYFVHRKAVKGVRREADLIFPRSRVAVFVDGCFWHGCPEHATWPKANAEWWRAKLERNRQRDRETDDRFRRAGWLPMRIWEHETPVKAARNISAVVKRRSEHGAKPFRPG